MGTGGERSPSPAVSSPAPVMRHFLGCPRPHYSCLESPSRQSPPRPRGTLSLSQDHWRQTGAPYPPVALLPAHQPPPRDSPRPRELRPLPYPPYGPVSLLQAYHL